MGADARRCARFELTPSAAELEDRSQTFFISHPDTYSVVVALLAGVAGMLSLQTAKSSALIGVLISVTTIPAAANVGVAAAYRDWDEWRGAALQLVINLSAIVVAGVSTLAVARWRHARRRARHAGVKAPSRSSSRPRSRIRQERPDARSPGRTTGPCETSSSP